MENKYKLYPISRYILLSNDNPNSATLYEMTEEMCYTNNKNIVMVIDEKQCTRVIRRYGKQYYKILV